MSIRGFLKRWRLADRTWWAIIRHGERRSRVVGQPTQAPQARPRVRTLDSDIGKRTHYVRTPPKFKVVAGIGGNAVTIYAGDNGAKARDAFHNARARREVSGVVLMDGSSERGSHGQVAGLV